MILLILSFVAGILTVLAPCILPLLPVIVGSSLSGVSNKKKAFVISASLGISIVLFTFLLKVSTIAISIPQETWAIVSGIIIILFGLVSLFPEIWEDLAFVGRLSIRANKLLGRGYKKESFWGDVIIGVALGPVFSSCSPTYFIILATVLPQSFAYGLLDLVAYAVGLSGTLLLVAFLGQRIVLKLGFALDTHNIFRRLIGLVFVLLGVTIILGLDRRFETQLLNHGVFDITKVEQLLLKLNDPGQVKTTTEGTSEDNDGMEAKKSAPSEVVQKLHGPKAPEIVNPSGFINTPRLVSGQAGPITIGEFHGKKVVLLDVWTYSCINCERTLPYVESWYEKYKDMGLVVIGLHTPEFAFEKLQKNVEDAVKRFGLTYPVVMDNDYSTWTAFGNQYWPRKYLINEDGEIIYDHIGEGNYDETERIIQTALSELNSRKIDVIVTTPKNAIPFDPSKVKSPEVYFGYKRNEYLSNGEPKSSGRQNLTLPDYINGNHLYLSGTWNFFDEYAANKTVGKIVFKYNAKNVYMVASSDAGVNVTIFRDGKKEKDLFIKENKLYNVIEGDDYGEHILEIDIPAVLKAFTFTFG